MITRRRSLPIPLFAMNSERFVGINANIIVCKPPAIATAMKNFGRLGGRLRPIDRFEAVEILGRTRLPSGSSTTALRNSHEDVSPPQRCDETPIKRGDGAADTVNQHLNAVHPRPRFAPGTFSAINKLKVGEIKPMLRPKIALQTKIKSNECIKAGPTPPIKYRARPVIRNRFTIESSAQSSR